MDKPLPDESGVLLDMYDEHKFSRDALARFPTLEPRLREAEDLLHVQMAVLADAAREALLRDDQDTCNDIFRFLNEALMRPRAIPEIANAVRLSFLQQDDFQSSENARQIWMSVPHRLKNLINKSD